LPRKTQLRSPPTIPIRHAHSNIPAPGAHPVVRAVRRYSPNSVQFIHKKICQFMGLEHVAIDTNNFDGEVAKIKAVGVKILEERVLPDGRRVCFFEGPQGVRLEFLEWK